MSSLPALDYIGISQVPQRAEERYHVRFPIVLDVEYRFTKNKVENRGRGRTLDISSGGLLFETDEALNEVEFRRNESIKVTLHWPYMLDEKCALKLVVRGRFVRRQGNRIAVTIEQYKFRTAGLVLDRPIYEGSTSGK